MKYAKITYCGKSMGQRLQIDLQILHDLLFLQLEVCYLLPIKNEVKHMV